MMQKQGRFEVYEGDSHPPMSPPNQQQPGAVMDQHLSRPSSLAAAVTDRYDIPDALALIQYIVAYARVWGLCPAGHGTSLLGSRASLA